MRTGFVYTKYLISCIALLLLAATNDTMAGQDLAIASLYRPQDTIRKSDRISLVYPFRDHTGNPWDRAVSSPLMLERPSNLKSSVVFDPESNEYIIYEKIGELDYRRPVYMSPDEYRKYEFDRSMRTYWQARLRGDENGVRTSLIPQIQVGGEAFDKVFGSNTINIIPQGSAELVFGINISRTDNPTLSEKLRTIPTFDFQEKIQMNVTGTIGDKMQLGINYNTEAMFDFENRTKLEYSGKEDEIIKKIEAGDVTLPLAGTLITGSHSLFGLKTELQFGKLTVTSVVSQQKGESSTMVVQGGAQMSEFEVYADEYEANKHFFLGQYFRDSYDRSMSNLPLVSSGINIERIEVWVTNKTSNFEETRNIVGFMDLAESQEHIYNPVPAFQAVPGKIYPSNAANGLYDQLQGAYQGVRDVDKVTDTFSPLYPDFQIGRDYEKIENARLLTEREYTLNKQLGYISLNVALNNDEVLAVAFEYTLGGQVFKVGEFSTDGISAPDALVLKLLKGTTLSPRLPTWDLMMKNIYSLGAYQVESSDFTLNVLYQDDETGNSINYIPEGNLSEEILLSVMGLDNLNSQRDRQADGMFDFIEGLTIDPSKGRIMFPVVEPFGSYLGSKFSDPVLADKYVFQELYDSTQTRAIQSAEKNKFKISGTYSSSSGSEIYLNALNIPQGGVTVTAGGVPLTENVDYTVDYNAGRVNIINPALIESQTPIQVSLESNQFFGFQTKTLLGTHLNYKISDDFNIGGTILHLNERPYTQKVNFGEEPISNTIFGFNSSYRSESPFITRMVDALPLVQTKAPSSVSFFGEFAQLLPGHSRAISSAGNSYIDDFEASEIPLDMKTYNAWVLASIPQGQDMLFPEARLNNNHASGYNRSRLSWYVIDPLFLRNGSTTPDHIKNNPDLQSSHFVREVYENELFPFKESPSGIPTNLAVLNLAFYPEERGPYNFETTGSSWSDGLGPDGTLVNPESRWGGIMREILTSDFENANIQYIKFWLMDPFVEDTDANGGDLYFNLGNISEDILRDSRKSFENGLPTSSEIVNVDSTQWGRVPTIQAVVQAFDNVPDSRKYQDVGLDGLSNTDEQVFFSTYLDEINNVVSDQQALQLIREDPSNDDFHYFRGSDYDSDQLGILERYKKYNGMEGNSPTSEMSEESYPTSGSTLPDMEDINRDNTLSETESYYQYKVSIRPQDMQVGTNYIVDEIEHTATLANGEKSTVKWYQFKIPVVDYERAIGGISDFKSVRFMRMFLRGFRDETILRFAKLDLVRAEWRKYNISFLEGGERVNIPEPDDGSFEISSVSIEENAGKEPVNYVLPPGFDRVIDPSNPQLRQLNEQSMVLRVFDLEDGDARAAFKNVNLDIRQYRKLRMEVHGEALSAYPLADDEVTVFIRIGSDYKDNFYEYEMPLKLTPPGYYNKDDESDRAIVWPEDNSFNIDLSVFQDAKQSRNEKLGLPGSTLSRSDIFVYPFEGARVSISGNPNLSNVRVIMVGIRNPIKTRGVTYDDGLTKSAEVWINELRLSDFNEDGGWAANARLQTRLADLGTFDIVGQTSTPGFGSLDTKVNERSKEQVVKYDMSSSIELGKFFPEESGVSIPVYIGYSESRVQPQYNPLDPDIPFKDALEQLDPGGRDSLRSISEDYTRRKTITVSNAGIKKQKEKQRPWDISNFSVNYTYNEVYQSDINTEINLEKNYRGGLNYNFNTRPKNISPFKNVKLFRPKAFRILRDFNFYLMPKQLGFRTDLSRYYNEIKTRNINNPYIRIEPTFRKDFEWTRFYDVKYDLSRQLKLDFSATNISRIDEPLGGVDRERYMDQYETWKDSVLVNLRDFGRNTHYRHNINVNYNIPVNKLPLMSWLSANMRYGATYDWLAGPVYPDSVNINLGNTIKNTNSGQFTGQANLTNLYNMSGFLKRVERNTRPGAAKSMKKEYTTVSYSRENIDFKEGRRRNIYHNLKTRDVKVSVYKADGTNLEGQVEIQSENKVVFTSTEDAEEGRIEVEGQVEVKRSPLVVMGEYFVRALMGVRNVSLSYQVNQGQVLPGYTPGTKYAGLTESGGVLAPGIGFVSGISESGFFERAMENGWLTTDTLLNTPALSTTNETFSLRSTVEPFPGLRIDLTADRRFARSISSYYTADRNGSYPDSLRNTMINGNFSISILSWGTAFEKIGDDNTYLSEAFEEFKNNTIIISRRRALERQKVDPLYEPEINPDTGLPIDGPYKNGYGPTSSEVLVPAFIAAYSKKDPEKVTLDMFPSYLHMMPNWRLTFDGLSRFDAVRKVFRSVNISHQYRSTYSIGAYTTNLYFDDSQDGISRIRDLNSNYIPQYELNVVTINEQFSPLLNVDLNWINSLTTRFEWKKNRTVSLNLANNQVADVRNNELIIGAGYRFDDVQVIIRAGGRQRPLRSDLNLRLDFSVRDNKTISRKLVEDVNQPVAGQRIFAIRSTADYVLSDRFNLQVFFDHNIRDPFVATTYRTSETNFGFSLKFTLVQ